MVIQLHTSTIPKKPPFASPSRVGIGIRGGNLLTAIALVVFSIMVGGALWVYFYKAHLIRAIGDMDLAVAEAKKSFEPEFIEVAARLNARIQGAQELLNTHIALSPLFDLLEKKTLEDMRFQDFNFSSADGQGSRISMKGQGKSFNTVALQSDVFGEEPSFKDPVFSNFTLNENGDVVFDFTTSLEPSLLMYREAVLGLETAEPVQDDLPVFDPMGAPLEDF